MSVPILFLLVPLALLLAGAAVYGFLWAVRTGQYDDVHTPALRLLTDDDTTAAHDLENTPPGRNSAGRMNPDRRKDDDGDAEQPVS